MENTYTTMLWRRTLNIYIYLYNIMNNKLYIIDLLIELYGSYCILKNIYIYINHA